MKFLTGFRLGDPISSPRVWRRAFSVLGGPTSVVVTVEVQEVEGEMRGLLGPALGVPPHAGHAVLN